MRLPSRETVKEILGAMCATLIVADSFLLFCVYAPVVHALGVNVVRGIVM
jgi:hypothetical protein